MKRNVTLQEVITKLNKANGVNSVKRLDELTETKEAIVSTGIIALDTALGVGGIRKGSIVEIFGPESAGKTTLALQLASQYQKNDMPVLYIDSEKSLIKETAERMGINAEKFYLYNACCLESALSACIDAAPAFGAIVIDSLAGLATKAQINDDVGKSHAGAVSKIMSDTLPVLTPILDDSGCTLIIINQLREKLGVLFGNPETTTGGRALKFYSSIRLDVRKVETLKQAGEIIGNHTRIKVVKNKIAPPFKEAEFDIIFDEGISYVGDVFNCAVEKKIISKQPYLGYLYNGKQIGGGIGTAKEYLKTHPVEFTEIRERLIELLRSA